VQAAPPVPQCAVLEVSQPPASQQPFGQEVALQAQEPPTHANPVPHAVQAAPPVPHSELVGGFTQVVPLQQPLGHEVALQTHALFKHS
jgi:hypothetical protein